MNTETIFEIVGCTTVERQEHSPIGIRLYSGFFYLSVQVLVVNERQELVPIVDVRQELVPITEVKITVS